MISRADLVVGLAFGLAGAGLLLVWCLIRIAARADRDEPAPPPRPEVPSGVEVLQTWLDRSQPSAEPPVEPIRLLPVVDEPTVPLPTIDPDHANRLLAEIDRVLADIAAAAPVEATAPRLRAVRSARPIDGTDHNPDDCCADHDPPVCRHFAPCCGTCPTLPVS